MVITIVPINSPKGMPVAFFCYPSHHHDHHFYKKKYLLFWLTWAVLLSRIFAPTWGPYTVSLNHYNFNRLVISLIPYIT